MKCAWSSSRSAHWPVTLALALALAGAGACAPAGALAADALAGQAPAPCRVPGIKTMVLCGSVTRPLDPAQPSGSSIEVGYVVVPALARAKLPDPVFLFAGGPGQSAIKLSPAWSQQLARLNNRRDLVFIDQRGTGRSAPLECDDQRHRPLAQQLDLQLGSVWLAQCREKLARLPYGDLRQFTTLIAMQDANAVRQALGAQRINLIGASYGTRAVLEYMRQFPQAVRRSVLDGVAPPDMVLPQSFSIDGQAAFDALLQACTAAPACAALHPALAADWTTLLQSLPRSAVVAHPLTGQREVLGVTRELVLGWVRTALYAPAAAAALPHAIGSAAQGNLEPLIGLGLALAARRNTALAEGMHFSVVCSEDLARMQGDAPAGQDFGDASAQFYRRACADWPRAEVPAAFYRLAPAPAAALLLSGGLDPATPPRHAERVARALGPLAKPVRVPNAGHGVMGLGCMRDVVARFIEAEDDSAALALDASCALAIPRPPVFVPVALRPAVPAASAGARP